MKTKHTLQKKTTRTFLVVVSLTLFLSCNKEKETEAYATNNFAYLDTLNTVPANNPITVEKVALGKRLFFDPLLSKNKDISCASCHEPRFAFADGVALSAIGTSKQTLDRNSPALFNLAWHTGFFWDGGKETLENQAFGPLRSKHEMGIDLDTLVQRLKNNNTYPLLFNQAFGDGLLIQNVVRAIASYERTLISFSSKYDDYKKGKTTFTPSELAGEKVFNTNCKTCHTPPLFTDTKYHNKGLDGEIDEEFENHKQGRYRITDNIEDQGKYKTPSLRNLAFTAPYTHDGRFETLNEVLLHLENPKKSSTLDPLLQDGIHLTEQEKNDLLLFLNTLNDYKFTQQ